MKDKIFKGFTPETFQFLSDLKMNNNKEWFEAHKDIYESELVLPLKALFQTLYPMMYSIDPEFEMHPHRAISPIYRDIRFSKNKDPYKTFMWMAFQLPVNREEWKDYPGYFLEIRENSYTLGLGLFQPKKKVMDNLRDAIAYDANEFERVTRETVLNRDYTVNGEEYKRLLPNDLPEYHQQWYQRKGIWVEKIKPIGEELYAASFVELIMDDFKALEWLYNLMKEATNI